MDYLIADQIVVSKRSQCQIAEKVIYLPNQFQVNPISRPSTDMHTSKTDFGLHEGAFVFCCFNSNWKITPTMFSCWMRILKKVSNSVLWVYAENVAAVKNLKREAESLGVPSERLIFARSTSRDSYQERFKFADLFLDTHPYNAGTTASDALWMGLPVLTLIGESFASRMAASLLTHVGLSDLIASTERDYEAIAISLATNPEKLVKVKTLLCANRVTASLFDTPRFTKHLESAFKIVYDRYCAGTAPDHVYVQPK